MRTATLCVKLSICCRKQHLFDIPNEYNEFDTLLAQCHDEARTVL